MSSSLKPLALERHDDEKAALRLLELRKEKQDLLNEVTGIDKKISNLLRKYPRTASVIGPIFHPPREKV